MIIGVKTISRDDMVEQKDRDQYRIMMVFFYNEGNLDSYYVDRYIMKLYKGGIIEWSGGVVNVT